MRTLLAPLLVAVLLASGCGEGDGAAADDREPSSGITGTVRLGPQCPVEQAGQPCPDQSAAHVPVTVSRMLPGEAYAAGEVVASGETDAEGGFRIAVPPGEYVVTAEAGMSCELMDARVEDSGWARVTVPCDTGIR